LCGPVGRQRHGYPGYYPRWRGADTCVVALPGDHPFPNMCMSVATSRPKRENRTSFAMARVSTQKSCTATTQQTRSGSVPVVCEFQVPVGSYSRVRRPRLDVLAVLGLVITVKDLVHDPVASRDRLGSRRDASDRPRTSPPHPRGLQLAPRQGAIRRDHQRHLSPNGAGLDARYTCGACQKCR
jgi:hypothetical protein